ncbi:MAG: hypothetical protein ABSC95_14420 [Acetobacteraceae bacterium]|jgi:hypothetical protein
MLTLAARSASKIPYSNASAYFYNALSTLKQKSKAAAAIIDFLENKSPTVQISVLVCEVEGAFGPFSMEWAFTGPCIVWTPGKSFTTRGADITGYRAATGAPIISGKKADVVYPSEIVLIHELGHAKQYIENPGWFASQGGGGAVVAGSKTTAEIEADNLRRHEHPVCKDYGLLQRQNYTDFLGFNDVPVPTSGRLY